MADKTKIEWADATVNAVNGCSVISPGCTNCYAMRLAGTRLRHLPSRAGLTIETRAGPVWTGESRFNESQLQAALAWRRPRRIFWNAHGDLFHDGVPALWIDRCIAAMAATPQHTHMVLTKRPERMLSYMKSIQSVPMLVFDGAALSDVRPHGPSREHFDRTAWPLPNVMVGVSVEDQTRAEERMPALLATPARKRFVSAEPLLGAIRLNPWLYDGVDWVICGGESGPGAREMAPAWARAVLNQCAVAGVPFFMKQMARKAPIPPDLLIREMPK